MSKHRLCSLIFTIMAVSLVSLSPAAALAQESTTGTISGQVINGTAGGGSVVGIEISLITYVDGVADEDKTEKTTTDGEGKFQFANADTENEYLVSAEYKEVSYYYLAVFEEGETIADVEVYVFDTTDSDEYIRVEQEYIIISVISAEEDYLLVTEFFIIVNDGDKTYVGADGVNGVVLAFTLPEGAADVYFYGRESQYEILDDSRVAYLESFPPEDRQIAFNYTLPVTSYNDLTIPLQIEYPTDALELNITVEGVEVAATHLAPTDPTVNDYGERVIRFWGEDLQRGTTINLYISESSSGVALLVILYVVTGLVIVGIVVYSVRRVVKRKRK